MSGKSDTVSVVAVTAFELYRLLEPLVVPTQSWNCVATLPGVHAKATLVPVSLLPGVGAVSAAGVAEPVAV